MLHVGKISDEESRQNARVMSSIARMCLMVTVTFFMALAFMQAAMAQSANTSKAGYGDANILFEQGKVFHDGNGVPRDLDKARSFYLRAAAAGNDFAKINLGYMAFVGEGTAKDYAASLKWYEQAANSGNRDAQRMMAVFYKNGLGVKVDTTTATLWDQRANTGWALPVTPAQNTQSPAASDPSPQAAAPVKLVSKSVTAMATQKETTVATLADAPTSDAPIIDTYSEALPVLLTPKVTTPELPTHAAIAGSETAAAPNTLSPSINLPVKPSVITDPSSPRLALIGMTMAALLACLVIVNLFGAFKRGRLRVDSDSFVELFYNRNAQILSNSYHRASNVINGRGHVSSTDINDQWVISVSLMMIRFAQMQETLTGSRSATSETLIAALRNGPIEARRAALPLIPKIKAIIEADENMQNEERPNERKARVAFNWPRFTKPLPGAATPAE